MDKPDDSSNAAQASDVPSFLAGGGEMGALMRAHDWHASPLGPPARWPQSLKTSIRIMLTSRQPIWIGWGEELLFFYNDPYKAIIGGKHPWALGQPTRIVWNEIWDDIGPLLATALTGVEGIFVEEKLLIMERNGYPEETYYTFSYSPVPDDHGATGGIICANSDDTARVLGERQLNLLRELATSAVEARTWRQACESSMRALSANPHDIPFALLYAREEGGAFELVAACGIEAGHPAAQPVLRPRRARCLAARCRRHAAQDAHRRDTGEPARHPAADGRMDAAAHACGDPSRSRRRAAPNATAS